MLPRLAPCKDPVHVWRTEPGGAPQLGDRCECGMLKVTKDRLERFKARKEAVDKRRIK